MFSECVRDKLNEYFTNHHKEEYSTKCNVPWIMNGIITRRIKESYARHHHNHGSKKRCNDRKIVSKQWTMSMMKFFNDASRYNLKGCKGNTLIIKGIFIYFDFIPFLYADWSITHTTKIVALSWQQGTNKMVKKWS